MHALLAILLAAVFAHEPLVSKYDAAGVRVSQQWGRGDIKSETFTADDKAMAISYPAQLQKMLGDSWLVPSYMGVRIDDTDFSREWSPNSFHYPGARAGVGEHLIAPFVIRMDGDAATLIALLKPIDDVQVNVSLGRVLFSHPKIAPGESITIAYYEGRFNSWYAAVDKARELYGIDTERGDLYRMFWRPGYLNAQLENATDETIDAGGFLPNYYQRDLDRKLGLILYWGQMSGHGGNCCERRLGFHERYENPAGLVPLHGDVGYYARTGDGESLAFYDDMVSRMRAEGHASVIYWDIVGAKRTVEPVQILMRADDIPTLIEGASMDLPLASMVGHRSLVNPNSMPELGRYLLRNRPLFAGYANVGSRDDVLAVYRECAMLGMGLDSWFWYDDEMAAFQNALLDEWERTGFWADRPQLVRRGLFLGNSGATYTARIENDRAIIEKSESER